jgi:hypothetical protein
MKYTVAIILLVIGLVVAEQLEDRTAEERRLPESSADVREMPGFNSSQCIFNSEEKSFTCKTAAESIECGAVCDTTVLGERHQNKFNVYGIGMMSEKVDGTPRFWMYPRRLDNSSYLNHTVVGEGGKVFDIVLGCGGDKAFEKSEVVGLRITDCKCYERLTKMFDESAKQPHMVRQETEPTVVQEIPLIGEVLVLDKHVQKRWLWGYGWGGLGWGGWGWGGWGYPYYGWGWGK